MTVIREASRAARFVAEPLLEGCMCLMPACVRDVAVAVTGVDVPDVSGVTAAGAMMEGVLCVIVRNIAGLCGVYGIRTRRADGVKIFGGRADSS